MVPIHPVVLEKKFALHISHWVAMLTYVPHWWPLFSVFSLVAILVGSRDHRTYFWKGAIQGSFHQSLVQIGPVASEELIKM
jgi:hypothetical protein